MDETVIFEVAKEGIGEYEEKKSRFIAVVKKVTSVTEAEDFIRAKKKECHDARHNCSAYIVTDDEGKTITRFSDDGEPAKTAGQPILEVLLHENLVNVVCVVTRYFGGILLGTGGLVRAYTTSTKEALANAALVRRQKGCPLTLVIDYANLSQAEYLLRENDIVPEDMVYEEKVTISCKVPVGVKDEFAAGLSQRTAGTAVLEWGKEDYI